MYRSFIPTSLHVLPTDKRVEEAAWNGRLVAAGPFAKAVAVLADQLPEAARPEQGQRRPRRRFGQRGLEAREPRR